jgi:ATP-dependent RNA helicase RhlE
MAQNCPAAAFTPANKDLEKDPMHGNATRKTDGPVKTFDELPIAALLKGNLRQAGFVTPTPVQAASLGPALAGRDILGTAQTGTGKTLAFVLPILERLLHARGGGIEALVLLPTRELAMQVLETLNLAGKGSGVASALVVGGLSEANQLSAIRAGARAVIATPGRLEDYVRRRLVSLKSVKILVLDEADRMVDMGFLPQMRSIMRDVARERQTMCFAATLGKEVAHLVHDYLRDPLRVEIGSTARAAGSVALRVCEVRREQKLALLVHLLETEKGTFLVFTRTKHGANALCRRLEQRGFAAAALHGNKSQAQRSKALAGFKTGRHRVLVATDVAARGIHVDRIAHVVNFDMPQEAEVFIHRVGRTGRVEETGTATTFVTPEETRDVREIERLLGAKIERLPLPSHLPAAPRESQRTAAAPHDRRAHAPSAGHAWPSRGSRRRRSRRRSA